MSLCELQPSFSDRVINTTTGKVHACTINPSLTRNKTAKLACAGTVSLLFDNYEEVSKGEHKINCGRCLKRLSMYDSDEDKSEGFLYGVRTKEGFFLSKNYRKPFTRDVLEARVFKTKENVFTARDLVVNEYKHKLTGKCITEEEYDSDLTYTGKQKYIKQPVRLKDGLEVVKIHVSVGEACNFLEK